MVAEAAADPDGPPDVEPAQAAENHQQKKRRLLENHGQGQAERPGIAGGAPVRRDGET